MSPRLPALTRCLTLALLATAIQGLPAWAQIGPIVTGEGPVNRSMGGASVAAPLDSIGALYWNPATTAALPNSADFGGELVLSQSALPSSLPANAFGTGLPPVPHGDARRGAPGGLYDPLEGGWRLGAAVKSPQWFEPFHFDSADSRGLPRSINHHFELPLIPSVGVAYSGFERWLLAADFRYVDFGNARGLRASGFDPTGAIRGV